LSDIDVVSIVSGGPSASLVDLASVPGFVIGVNNAALHLTRIDGAITMDRRWSEAHWPYFLEKAGAIKLWLRPNNVMNLKKLPEWKPDWVTVFQCDHKSHRMSDEPGKLNGTNSGGVALNLAYQMQPKKLYLFGFDYRPGPKQEMHWFARGETGRVGDYPIHTGRYGNWAREFNDVGLQFRAKGIDVVNVSSISLVTAFRKMSPAEYMKGAR
jgi:hypothetical protein